jgi:hypothetical protein
VPDAVPGRVALVHPLQQIAGEAAQIAYWLDVDGALGAMNGACDLPQPLGEFRAERLPQRLGDMYNPMDVRIAAAVFESPDVMGRHRPSVPSHRTKWLSRSFSNRALTCSGGQSM